MATLAELISTNPKKIQELLDLARLSEEEKAKQSLAKKTADEAAKGQAALKKTKAIESESSEFANKKAKALAKATKAAEGSVGKDVISDLPRISGRMSAAMEKAASAAAGVAGEDVITLPAPKSSSFLEKISHLAKTAGPTALEKAGLSKNTITSLLEKAAPVAKLGSKIATPVGLALDVAAASSAGEESDVPKNPFTGEARQLSNEESLVLSPGTPVKYSPSGGRTEMSPAMASSKYDSLQNIIADTSRPPEDTNTRMLAASTQPETEEAKQVLTPKPRTVSAGEPSVTQVAKQAEDAALDKILNQKSEYEDLLARYKEAEERQRLAQLGVSLGQAGERIGSAIAMVKPGDQSFYEQQMKLAGGITEQFKEEEAIAREAKRNDANSEESKSARALLKEQGIPVPETVTAAFIEKQYPQFANILAQRRAAEERAEGRRERREEREFALKSRDQQRDDDFIFRGMEKLTVDPTYKARQKIIRGKSLVDEAVKSPTSFGDVASLYTAITALDPESVVREGEIKLTREGESLGESIQRQVRRLGPNPRLLSDRLLSDIKKYVDLIDKQTAETYNLKRDALFQQAENRGIEKGRYKAMDPFLLKEERAPQAPEKIIVEKDGKRYKLPKEQLQRALSQGYKEVE